MALCSPLSFCTVAALAVFPAALAAQGAVVVPSLYAAVDGRGLSDYPFSRADARTQLIVDSASVATAAGVITAIEFRANNEGQSSPLPATTVHNVTVRLSQTGVTPTTMSGTFANNITASPSVGFQGSVALPAYTSRPTSVAPWSVRIPLSTPFGFTTAAGDLLFDITVANAPPSGPQYWLDAATADGAITRFGNQGPNLAPLEITSVPGGRLFPGGTMFVIYESYDASVFHGVPVAGATLFAQSRLATPLDLTSVGAPGNFLHLLPVVQVPFATQAIVPPCAAFEGSVAFNVPNSSALVGARLAAQGAVAAPSANPLGIVALEGFEFTFADGKPHPVAQVQAPSSTATFGAKPLAALVLRLVGSFQ